MKHNVCKPSSTLTNVSNFIFSFLDSKKFLHHHKLYPKSQFFINCTQDHILLIRRFIYPWEIGVHYLINRDIFSAYFGRHLFSHRFCNEKLLDVTGSSIFYIFRLQLGFSPYPVIIFQLSSINCPPKTWQRGFFCCYLIEVEAKNELQCFIIK